MCPEFLHENPSKVAETTLGHAVGNKVERSYQRNDLLDLLETSGARSCSRGRTISVRGDAAGEKPVVQDREGGGRLRDPDRMAHH